MHTTLFNGIEGRRNIPRHKRQGLVIKDGLCFESVPSSKNQRMVMITGANGCHTSVPSWVASEKQVLRFDAISTERVPESPSERIRTLKFSILYYLEDGTLSIIAKNSNGDGLPEGTFLRRHFVDGIQIQDLMVGASLIIYGREYLIIGVDRFTFDYYASTGICQPTSKIDAGTQELGVPDAGSVSYPSRCRTPQCVNTEKTIQYLSNDRKVCRFFAEARCYDPIRRFVILCYLSDDTIEIREEFSRNSGLDEISVWFRRGKLHSNGSPVLTSEDPNPPFDIRKLNVGSTVEVVHQTFFIIGTDPFTRKWFQDMFEIELAIEANIPTKTEAKALVTPQPCDQTGTDSDAVLRCSCRKLNGSLEEAGRGFIVSFFVRSNEVSIFEPNVRNSGIMGGRFLEKGRYMNKVTGKFMQASDMSYGSEFEILSHRFRVYEVDKKTQSYLDAPQRSPYQPQAESSGTSSVQSCLLQNLFASRPGFEKRLLKELCFLNHNSRTASVELLGKALDNLGHSATKEQVVGSLKTLRLTFDGDAFNIYSLVESIQRSRPL